MHYLTVTCANSYKINTSKLVLILHIVFGQMKPIIVSIINALTLLVYCIVLTFIGSTFMQRHKHLMHCKEYVLLEVIIGKNKYTRAIHSNSKVFVCIFTS